MNPTGPQNPKEIETLTAKLILFTRPLFFKLPRG